jgi:hypothetical protein
MEALLIPALVDLAEYCAAHTDVLKKLWSDMDALFHGHPTAASVDANIALQAGLMAAKASAYTTVQMRIAAGIVGAATAVVHGAPTAPVVDPNINHG